MQSVFASPNSADIRGDFTFKEKWWASECPTLRRFPPDAERTYDRSFEKFAEAWGLGK